MRPIVGAAAVAGQSLHIAALVAAWLFLPGSVLAHADTRVALVIGNGAYKNVASLPNPTNDAGDIARAFTRLGFAVTHVTDAPFAMMESVLGEFGQRAVSADMAVIYFAGHGVAVAGQNWLLPVDAKLDEDANVAKEAVSLRVMMNLVNKASRLSLVILDACRDNPFLDTMHRSLRMRGGAPLPGMAKVEPIDNVVVAFSARDGTTAIDGVNGQRNSPFTAALLQNIETPGVEVNFIFRAVSDEVLTATQRAQQPVTYGQFPKAEIFFKPVVRSGTGPVSPPASTPGQVASLPLAPQVSGPKIVRRIATQGYNGADYVEGIYSRDERGNWEETDKKNPNTRLRFVEKSANSAEVVMHDDLRDLYLRFDLKAKRLFFRMGAKGQWVAFYKIVEDVRVTDERSPGRATRRIGVRGYMGAQFIEGDFTRDSAGNWEETNRKDPATRLRYVEQKNNAAEIVIFDDVRNLYIQFRLPEQRLYFRNGPKGQWNSFYKMIDDEKPVQSAR